MKYLTHKQSKHVASTTMVIRRHMPCHPIFYYFQELMQAHNMKGRYCAVQKVVMMILVMMDMR